ncbi:MAG: thiamine diphosphokinase [Chlamydiales bacterium]
MLTLVANGIPPNQIFLSTLAKKSQGIVAIDGGLVACDEAGIDVDLILGDFDSVPQTLLDKYSDLIKIKTPNQNKSDLEKAIEYLVYSGFEMFTVCGALGKRIDHTLKNIHLLCNYPETMQFQSEYESCFAIPKSYILSCKKGQTISLIPISSRVSGVITQGLKWEIKNQTLTKSFSSLSNQAIQEKVSIQFDEGDLLLTINS